ncbi:MAG: CaiB/BaiF CoA-transferase family protein [Elusimicrobiota bacterium]
MKPGTDITVLDFSKLLPGPFCTMILADFGCRVIRVELPHWPDTLREYGPRIGGHGFCYWMANRNKESLCLDFRKPAGLRVLAKLLAKADVLVEGFRPGLMGRLGLGPRALLRRFPRLSYCSITGYGREGPLSRRAGHDINFLAESGFLGAGDSNGEVSFPAAQVADLGGATTAAAAILAALLARATTGRGRRIEVSMTETAFSWLVLPLGFSFATGRPFDPAEHWWSGRHPFYRIYRTKDGRRLAVGALERPLAVDLLRRIGRGDLVAALDRADARGLDAIERELERAFLKRTLAHWRRKLGGSDVCVSPVRTVPEALGQARRSRGNAVVRLTRGKGLPYVRSPVLVGGKELRLRRPPPALGADNEAVLRSAGIGAAEIRRLKASGMLFSKS